MTVQELIERLEECDEDCEVRLAFQPSWPLQFTIAGVAEYDPDEDDEDESRDDRPVVFICDSGQHPDDAAYAPRRVFDDCY